MSLSQEVSLIGTCKLVSVEVHYESGEMIYPWGHSPQGHIVYSPDGYMSAVIASSERPLFAVNDLLEGTIEEQAQAARTYLSYGGPYRVEGDKVVHSVEVSLFPNWVGMKQVRYIDNIAADHLVLRTPPMLLAGQSGAGYLIWQRH